MDFTLLRVQRAMSSDVVCMETDGILDCNREMASTSEAEMSIAHLFFS